MTIIRDYASLSDSWALTNSSSPTTPSSPHEAIHRHGVTADSPANSFSAGKPLEHYALKHFGKRLDYILFRQPHQYHPHHRAPVLEPKESKVVFTDKVPGSNFSYSDHFGLETTFEIIVPDDSTPSHPTPPPNPNPNPTLSPTSITTTLQALTSAYRLSLTRSQRELTIFGLCILLLLSLSLASAWLPPASWVNPMYMLLTIVVAWLATTMFYEGFLYGRWEVNALMNVIEELEVYRKAVEGGAS
jgi:sphingomyelin phosphodiesterase 2